MAHVSDETTPKQKWHGLLHKRNPYHKVLKVMGSKKNNVLVNAPDAVAAVPNAVAAVPKSEPVGAAPAQAPIQAPPIKAPVRQNTAAMDAELARLEAENDEMEKRLQLTSRPSFKAVMAPPTEDSPTTLVTVEASGRAASVRHARCNALVLAFQEGRCYGQPAFVAVVA